MTIKCPVIAITCHKGGSGKTTTSQSLAGYFARSGKKVLVIDTDEQSNIKMVFGVRPYDRGLAAILMDPHLRPEMVTSKTGYENIDILHSGGRHIKEAESHFTALDVVRSRCESLKDYYDVILIDTPPAMSLVASNGISFADYALITADPGILSVAGARATVDFIHGMLAGKFKIPVPRLLGVVLTQFDSRRNADAESFNLLDQYVTDGGLKGGSMLHTIGMDTKVRMSQLRRKHLFDFAPTSKATLDYQKLGDDVSKEVFA